VAAISRDDSLTGEYTGKATGAEHVRPPRTSDNSYMHRQKHPGMMIPAATTPSPTSAPVTIPV